MKYLSKRKRTSIEKMFEQKKKRRMNKDLEQRRPKGFRKRESVIRMLAPNLDQMLIVSSFGNPVFKPGLVDRLLTLSSLEDLPAILVLNKADLIGRETIERSARIYRSIGYTVIVSSTKTREGVDSLADLLRDRVTGVCGHSGVGKSSLLRALDPDLGGVRVGEVSLSTGKGKHTSTEVRSLPLSGGGRVFDLPGLKLAPVQGIERQELADHFLDFRGGARKCRFGDCLHVHEPDCGVKFDRDSGMIAESRYSSYLKILSEL